MYIFRRVTRHSGSRVPIVKDSYLSYFGKTVMFNTRTGKIIKNFSEFGIYVVLHTAPHAENCGFIDILSSRQFDAIQSDLPRVIERQEWEF